MTASILLSLLNESHENVVCSCGGKKDQYSLWNTNREQQERLWAFSSMGKLSTFLCEALCVLCLPVCVSISPARYYYVKTTNVSPAHRTNAQCMTGPLWQTFAFAGAEAATLLAGGGGALVEGRSLLVALKAGDFTMHLIGQVPQQAHAVLYQLQRWRGNIQVQKRDQGKLRS